MLWTGTNSNLWYDYIYEQNTEEASKAFIGSNPEILNNKLYQDQKIDLREE